MKKICNILSASCILLASPTVFSGTMGAENQDHNMNGLYIGVGTGINTAFVKDNLTVSRVFLNGAIASSFAGGNPGTQRYTYSSILFSGDIGYGVMVKSKTYLGIKGFVYYTPLNDTRSLGAADGLDPGLGIDSTSIRTQLNPVFNIDAVFGYEVWKHFLPFIEAGVGFAGVNNSYTVDGLVVNRTTLNASKYRYNYQADSYKTGFNVGLGANYNPNPAWLFTTELVYNYIGKSSGAHSSNIAFTTGQIETRRNSITAQNLALFGSVSRLFNV